MAAVSAAQSFRRLDFQGFDIVVTKYLRERQHVIDIQPMGLMTSWVHRRVGFVRDETATRGVHTYTFLNIKACCALLPHFFADPTCFRWN